MRLGTSARRRVVFLAATVAAVLISITSRSPAAEPPHGEDARLQVESDRRTFDQLKREIATAQQAIAKDKEERKSGFVALPNVSYAPETDLALGGYGMYYRHFGDPDETRPSRFALSLTGTTREQAYAWTEDEVWFAKDALVAYFYAEIGHYPNLYYGIGNDTSESQGEGYTSRYVNGEIAVRARAIDALYLGVRGAGGIRSIFDLEAGRELASGNVVGADGGRAFELGPSIAYDTRDNVNASARGTLALLSYGYAAPAIGSEFRYSQLRLEARQFIPVFGTHVLAGRFIGQLSEGATPFTSLSQIGGEGMRGIFYGRFRDNHMLQAEVEYRFPIAWRFGGTGFVGAGEVARSVADVSFSGMKPIGGVGLRFLLVREERLNIRFDVAASAEGLLYYLDVGEAF